MKTALTQDALAEVFASDTPVVFYCNGHSCMRSSKTAEMAVEWGFTPKYYFRDGYPAWESGSFPIEEPITLSNNDQGQHPCHFPIELL